MNFKTDKLLGGLLNIQGLKPRAKVKPDESLGTIKMIGVYTSGGELPRITKSSVDVSQDLLGKFQGLQPSYYNKLATVSARMTCGYTPEELRTEAMSEAGAQKYYDEP